MCYFRTMTDFNHLLLENCITVSIPVVLLLIYPAYGHNWFLDLSLKMEGVLGIHFSRLLTASVFKASELKPRHLTIGNVHEDRNGMARCVPPDKSREKNLSIYERDRICEISSG